MVASALIYDLDGTLWDSHPLFERAFGPEGSGIADRLRAGDNVVKLLGEVGVARTAFVAACCDQGAIDAVYPGVHEALAELSLRGVPMGIVTNLPSWLVRPLLGACDLDSHFEVVECAAGKPSPRGIVRALSALEASDGDRYYLGDSLNDALAASRAGVRFAWTSYGYSSDVPPGSVDVVLSSFPEVLEL